MHFLDAWTELGPIDLFRLALPAVLLVIAVFIPGRRIAYAISGVVAAAVLGLQELGPLWPDRMAWAALWLLVMWRTGVPARTRRTRITVRVSGIESGAIGLMLGLALASLLIAAVARQDLDHHTSRATSYGVLMLCLGLLHLMLRRDSLRSMVAFGTLGIGLQVLERTARGSILSTDLALRGMVLLGTLIAVALAARLAWIREREAGSAWVSDAHDLHD